MARPRLCRRVSSLPRATYFKPRGVPLDEMDEVRLPVEGLEALKLADLLSLTTSEAAARMGVSRHTFGRILGEARQAVAKALVDALALRIDGDEHPAQDELEEGSHLSMDTVAVSAQGPGLENLTAPRFGRAAGFVVVDLGSMRTRYLDNGPSLAMAHGAGIQAAERIAGAGAGVLLTGVVGPKAAKALASAGVQVWHILEHMTVLQAVEGYKAERVGVSDEQ